MRSYTRGIQKTLFSAIQPGCSEGFTPLIAEYKEVERNPGYVFFKQCPEMAALWLVHAGTGRITIASSPPLLLHGGMVGLFKPQLPRKIEVTSKEPLRTTIVLLHSSPASELLLADRHCLCFTTRHLLQYQQLLASVQEEMPAHDRFGAEIADQLIRLLVAYCRREHHRPESRRTNELFFRCKAFIDTHGTSLERLSQITAALGIHRSTVYRLFRTHGYPSPYTYLNQRKMQHAAQLLSSSEETVSGIAARCGYTSPFEFSRVFKRVFGVSPKMWRINHHE